LFSENQPQFPFSDSSQFDFGAPLRGGFDSILKEADTLIRQTENVLNNNGFATG
jgi:hypothetical protein